MGTLYSCILKAISTVYGPGGPDTGGPTDPDDCVTGAIGACCNDVGEGCDPPDNDCDIIITAYYCTYSPDGQGSCFMTEAFFTKAELVTAGVLVSCSDPLPLVSFDIGGTTYYIEQGAISCCSPFDYYSCGVRPPCTPNHAGCSDITEVQLNIAPGGNPPVFTNLPGGGVGYITRGACKQANDGCCDDPYPPPDPDDVPGDIIIVDPPIGALCRCKLEGSPNAQTTDLAGGGYQVVGTFVQICEEAGATGEVDNQAVLDAWRNTIHTAADPGVTCTEQAPTGDFWKDCTTGGHCGGGCGDVEAIMTCIPTVCIDLDDTVVEDALITSYSHINEPFYDQNNPEWLVCPGGDNIAFAPAKGPDALWLNDVDLETTLSIAGPLSPQIDQDTGIIIISNDALAGATGEQNLTVTLTTVCGGTTSTGEIVLRFDPTDMVICSDYDSCEGLPDNCDFTNDPPNPVTTLKVYAPIPFPNQPWGDSLQFTGEPLLDNAGGGLAYLEPDALNSLLFAWKACDANTNGAAILFIDPLDENGDPVLTLDINHGDMYIQAPQGNGYLSFTTTNIIPDSIGGIPGRIMIILNFVTGNAKNNTAGNDFFINFFFTDSEGLKSLALYCQGSAGGSAPNYASYPNYINCSEGLPGLGFGKKFLNALSFRNTLRNFRASYSTRQSSRGSAQKDYLEGLSRRRSSEVLLNPVTANETYAPSIRLPFIPYKTRTRYYRNIFSKIIDYRIRLIREYYDSPNDATDYSESIFQDLTLQNIHQSLTKEFRVKVNNLKNADGTPLKDKILRKIKDLVIKDQLGSFNISDINDLGTLSKAIDPGLVVGRSFTAIEEIITTVNNSKSLNPLEYRGVGAQRIRRWKTIASDLSKNLPIIEEDLSVEQLFVHDTDLIDFALSDGTSTSVPITDFDEINFIKADGTQSTLNLDTQIHRSKVMDFEDLTNSFKKINDTFNIKLTASSAAVAKIEEDASLSSNRSSEYVFKLDPSSLTDLDRRSPIIRLTSCKYDLITDPVEIEDWTKNKVYPFYSFYINHTDLFLDHMEKKEQLTAEYKDISFDSFASSESEEYAVIPRRIPWYIVVIPTDRNDLLTSIGVSKLVDYQTRVISFKLSSKTSDYKQNYSSPIMDENQSDYFLNTATGREYFDYFTYKYNDTKVKDTIKPFKNGYEILPRPEPSTRALFKAIREVVADGNEFVERNSNTITWGSVYKRMSKQDKKSVSLVDSFNFLDLKSKFLLGKISSNATINAEFGKVKDSVNSGIKNISDYVPVVAKKMTIEKLVEDSVEEFPGE